MDDCGIFSGFPREGLEFLTVLGTKDKAWFERNRSTYDHAVMGPAKAFVTALGERIADEISPGVVAQPKTNGSIAPINNNLRFSSDRPPYKDHLLFKFWEGDEKKTAPTLWVRISEAEVGFASGAQFHSVERWRELVDDEATGAELQAILTELGRGRNLDIIGRHYKKVPKPFDETHPRADLLHHKDRLRARWSEPTPTSVTEASFVDWCMNRLTACIDLHHWFTANLQPTTPTTEATGEELLTLAMRMEDEARSATDHDLERVAGFLAGTLGRWYDAKSGGNPPSVEPSNIIITAGPSTGFDPVATALLDPDEQLAVAETAESSGEDDNNDESAADDGDTGESRGEDDGGTYDERNGVFDACATLAQVAMGRVRTDDESWDDVIRLLEADRRPTLASALWVGLAAEPALRYRSVEQWRRSVEAAIRSDAATAIMIDEEDRERRTAPILVTVAVVVAVAVGAFVLLRNDTTTVEDAGVATTATGGAAAAGTDEPASTRESTTGSTDASTDESSALDQREGSGDPCALVGPLGPITIDQVSDTAIVVAWPPGTEAVDILLDGSFVDTMPAEAFRYVIERQPLSEEPLVPDTDYLVAVQPPSGVPSTACTTTLSNPVPGSEFLIGVTAPTGFEVIDTTATSITVGWDARAGADLHNLFLDGAYIQFGDVGGSSAIGDETEFTFIDLEPDTTYEIGIRRVEGPNESGLVTITASTDSR